MPVSITNFGNLVKVDIGNGVVQYFDNEEVPRILQLNNITSRVAILNGNATLVDVALSQLSINGVIPASVADFDAAIGDLMHGALFSKIDPLAAVGYASTALSSRVRRIVGLGNNPDVDQGTVPENIWPAGGLYPWLSAATALEIVSSSTQDSSTGTGMAAVSITFLDANYNESVVSVALNGTTPVTISGAWLRINGAVTTTKGSGAATSRVFNVGDISIRDFGGGTTRAIIPAGKGILRQCIFTVPAGYTAQVLSLYIAFNRGTGGGATRYLTVSTYVQSSTGVSRLPLDISCNGESYRHDGIPGIVLPEKTDFALEIISVSADNSDITGAFLGMLMKNTLVSTIYY